MTFVDITNMYQCSNIVNNKGMKKRQKIMHRVIRKNI